MKDVDDIIENFDVTDMQARIIDEIVSDPDATSSEIAARVDTHPAYPNRIREVYADVIHEVADERGVDLEDEHFYRRSRPSTSGPSETEKPSRDDERA